MLNLHAVRQDLVHLLDTVNGLTLYDGYTDRVASPCAVVLPAEQWLTKGGGFGEVTVSLKTVIIAGPAMASPTLAELEALVATVLAVTFTSPWQLMSADVPAPQADTVNAAPELLTTLTFSRSIRVKD